MTKDRRLGRGLAALLGTPVEDGSGTTNTPINSTSTNASIGISADSAMTELTSTRRDPAASSPASSSAIAGSIRSSSNPLTTPTATMAPSSNSILPGALQTNQSSTTAPTSPSPFPQPSNRADTIRQLSSDAQSRNASGRSGVSPISIPMPTAAAEPTVEVRGATPTDRPTLDILVELIDANPFQPRRQFNPAEIESLAESLKEHQQLQPILVRRVGERYQLISGERRLRATIHAGLPTIRAEVRVADDRLVAELAIIENLQRKDLNAIEKALSFKRYITEHQCTQDELAQRLKIDRSTIANMMRLLELPEAITDAVQREEISAGHAKALLSLGSIKEQVAMLKKVRDEGWSVRETEARVAEVVAAAAASEDGILGVVPRRKASKNEHLASLERDLKMQLGTRVDISQTSRGRGRITIHFTSVEEFERLRSLLANDRAARAKAG